ncbi:MAG: hypothetical protein KatS3mg111_3759 [Pirellulaceae bacterium]|nr:MAG: hypothetical protein KatS3mg111_3759 [Pirellulaceae bacterium]
MSTIANPPRPTADSQPLRGRRFALLNRLLYAMTAIGLVAIAVTVYAFFASVSGIELNPITFELRTFTYHRDPLTGRQLTAIRHGSTGRFDPWQDNQSETASEISPLIAKHLRSAAPLPTRWDLVQIRTSTLLDHGPARILQHMLDTRRPSYDAFWPQWSKDHPGLASSFWPAVQALAYAHAYTDIPALFELVSTEGTVVGPEEFKQRLADIVFPRLREAAIAAESRGDRGLAHALATLAIEYGNDPALQPILESKTVLEKR